MELRVAGIRDSVMVAVEREAYRRIDNAKVTLKHLLTPYALTPSGTPSYTLLVEPSLIHPIDA